MVSEYIEYILPFILAALALALAARFRSKSSACGPFVNKNTNGNETRGLMKRYRTPTTPFINSKGGYRGLGRAEPGMFQFKATELKSEGGYSTLKAGEYISFPEREGGANRGFFVQEANGAVALYRGGAEDPTKVWSTAIAQQGPGDYYTVLQHDGVLATISAVNGRVMWHAPNNAYPTALGPFRARLCPTGERPSLCVYNNSGLLLYTVPSPPEEKGTELRSDGNNTLREGEYIVHPWGLYHLIQQPTGSLELWGGSSQTVRGKLLWSSIPPQLGDTEKAKGDNKWMTVLGDDGFLCTLSETTRENIWCARAEGGKLDISSDMGPFRAEICGPFFAVCVYSTTQNPGTPLYKAGRIPIDPKPCSYYIPFIGCADWLIP